MVDMYIYGVSLRSENPKEPERVFFVARSISEVFDVLSKNDDYFTRFISVDLVASCKTL